MHGATIKKICSWYILYTFEHVLHKIADRQNIAWICHRREDIFSYLAEFRRVMYEYSATDKICQGAKGTTKFHLDTFFKRQIFQFTWKSPTLIPFVAYVPCIVLIYKVTALCPILIIVQRDATQSSLFIIVQVHSKSFRCQPHPSSGIHKTVTTASGTVYAVLYSYLSPAWPS